jgi:lipopolysaccharide cholinephosphotransferase
MERIGIDVIHARVLAIAKEFDKICTRHHIPYYMLGGTMLGAIRHKGFIPWDDDMDFGVPIEHYTELISCLERELSASFRCCTYKNHPAILYNYMKIEDHSTCIDDKAISLPLEQKLGVNIDVFPLNVCTLGGKAEGKVRKKEDLLGMIYQESFTHPNSHLRKIAKKCLQLVYGKNPRKLQEEIDRMLFSIHQGDYLGNLFGRWAEKEIVPIEWYGSNKRYEFEDTSFIGLEDYDKYLTRLYGDYMKLPPENKRVAHVENVYIR